MIFLRDKIIIDSPDFPFQGEELQPYNITMFSLRKGGVWLLINVLRYIYLLESIDMFIVKPLRRPTDPKSENAFVSKQIKVNGLRGSTFKQHTTDQPRSYLVGFALTVNIRYSNGQRKTHQIAQIQSPCRATETTIHNN